MIAWGIFLLLSFSTDAKAEEIILAQTVKIEGSLREKGTRNPLPQTNLYCFSENLPEKPVKTITDQNGHFSIEVPPGLLKWVVSIPNYNRLEVKDEQKAGQENRVREFFLKKNSYLTYETTIYDQNEKRDEKTKSLDQSQFLTVPGANGDPIKAIQNLPGINRGNPLSAQVIIEGSSPNDTRYNIDNQNVPLIFHFGGLSSVVIPEAIDHVDYLSAGFGPEFGQSTAGMVNLFIKDPLKDRIHAFAYFDLINAGGMIEGPITDTSSFLFGIRQSYIGFVLGAALKGNSDFNLTAVPDFRDMVLEYKNQFTPNDAFKTVFTGSQDKLGFLFSQSSSQDPSVRGSFDESTDFFRVIPEYTHKFNSDMVGRLTVGAGKDWIHFNVGSIYLNTNSTAFTGRAEIEDQLTPAWKNYWGIDTQLYWSNISFQLPISSSASTTYRTVSNTYATNATGFYWRNILHPTDSRWTFTPGFRLSYYNFTNEWMPEPRIGAKYFLGDGWTIRAASGLYNEAPSVQNLDSNYGNPNLKSQRAVHGTLGFEKEFKEGAVNGLTITDDFFYKYLYSYVASSTAYITPSQPEYYNNSGFGRIFGMELLTKYKASIFEGWIAYTLSRSTLGNSQLAEALSSYDQTHLLTFVGSVNLGKDWKAGLRVRYTTGSPYTPVSYGVLDINNDSYTPIRGATYSARLGSFFQTDIRIDKKWIYNQWILSLYLDIQNVTNQQNPLQVNYSYDYRQSAVITGLPILPTLGVKAEF